MSVNRSRTVIGKSWGQIEHWLEENWKGRQELPSGANDDEIQELETALDRKLPKQFLECYKCHNGSGRIALFPLWGELFPLMSLSKCLGIWQSIQKAVARGSFDYTEFTNHPEGPIKHTWLDPGWVPIVHDGSGDHFFVDLSPARGGKRGQVIEFSRTAGANRIVANSIGELLAKSAEDLIAGKYYYDKKKQGLSPKVQ